MSDLISANLPWLFLLLAFVSGVAVMYWEWRQEQRQKRMASLDERHVQSILYGYRGNIINICPANIPENL